MNADQVTAPRNASPKIKEQAKRVNALARKIDSAHRRIATASNRVVSLDRGFWKTSKRDRAQIARNARSASTTQIDLTSLRMQHTLALAAYNTMMADSHIPATPKQLADWARQVAVGELTLVTGTINNETVATYEWSGDDIDRLKAALQRDGDDAGRGVLAAVGRPPIIITEGELPTFEKALEKAEAARNQVVVDAVWRLRWPHPHHGHHLSPRNGHPSSPHMRKPADSPSTVESTLVLG